MDKKRKKPKLHSVSVRIPTDIYKHVQATANDNYISLNAALIKILKLAIAINSAK